MSLTYDNNVLDFIVSGFDPIYGARSIQNQVILNVFLSYILQVEIEILNKLAHMFIHDELKNVAHIHIIIDESDPVDPLKVHTTLEAPPTSTDRFYFF